MKRLLRYVWIEAIPGAAGRPFSLLNPLRRAHRRSLCWPSPPSAHLLAAPRRQSAKKMQRSCMIKHLMHIKHPVDF
ncbi:hypothetical protein [Raoultella ornithinolytica]|uniref:hypothetical protein n=1 Tax=Raoultella ornithinolytica TaxID=54291 RepID=UPI0012D4131D